MTFGLDGISHASMPSHLESHWYWTVSSRTRKATAAPDGFAVDTLGNIWASGPGRHRGH